MNKFSILTVAFLSLFIFSNCSSDSNDPTPDPTPDPDPVVTLNNEINDFVWKGLNSEYYWQTDVPNLADTKDDNQDTYFTYLNMYTNPEDLFGSLLFDYPNTDRFSWFIDDYDEQNASFRGITDSFGFDFGLARVSSASEEVIGYVTYVVPNSPADDADFKRGDIFNVFNGTTLTLSNYQVVNAYYTDNTISLGFATIDNGQVVSNGKNSTLNIREVIENPIHYTDIITNGDGTKIGYMMYNGFKYTFHEELNDAFGEFKSQGIQELVIDLRYNGGGSVLTSAYLASMIDGNPSNVDVFAKLRYNSKNAVQNGVYTYFNNGNIYNIEGVKTGEFTINRLNTLNRVFVIVSGDTASASEMIINGLRGHNMEVILIGEKTYGKNVGSYTVYDSPDFTSSNVNPNHKNAMQPITFKIFNAKDESDYTQGFTPQYEVIEYVSEMKPFGDIDEPLFKAALDVISGQMVRPIDTKSLELETELLTTSLAKKRFAKEMYQIEDEIR